MWLCKVLLLFKTYLFVLVVGENKKNSRLQDDLYKDCDYHQSIDSDLTSYYIFSPNYPEKYRPNSRCRWQLQAMENHKIVVHCNKVDMYESVNCTDDSIAISTSADELLTDAEKFCAPVNFVAISDKNEMILVFTSSKSSKGGIFACSAGVEHIPTGSKKSLSQRRFMYQRDVSAVLKKSNDLKTYASPPSDSKRKRPSEKRRRCRSFSASTITRKIDDSKDINGVDNIDIRNNYNNEKENKNITECDCGWTSYSRIVNGESTGRHEFPSISGLVITETGRVYCGGAIITKRHIVTAAHCITEKPPGTGTVLINGYEIRKGNYSAGSRFYEIQKTYVHPNYDQKLALNDIGIIEVKGSFNFDENSAPVCLPFKHRNETFVGKSVEVAGWGTMSYGGKQPVLLQKAALQIVPSVNCSQTFGESRIRDTTMCAVGQNESDTCQGDSGGPLLWTDPRTGRFILAGIISYGIGCASGEPSVNTRMSVPAYLRWIKKIAKGYPFCVK